MGAGPSAFKAAHTCNPTPSLVARWSRLLCVGSVYASPALAELLAATADAVRAVRAGRSLTEALAAVPAAHRGGTQALAFTVLRRWGAAHAVRQLLAARAPAPWVDALLTSALALADPNAPPTYPPHTLVDQTVAAVRRRVPTASGFVNAVLRRALREPQAWSEAGKRDLQARWNHPPWWIERLRADWPQHWQAMLESAQQHPPMTLRVNARRATGAQWLQRLEASGRTGRVLEGAGYGGQAVVLDTPCAVQELPGFEEGDVSVQDASAQRAAPMLIGGGSLGAPLPPGARVLDACAAPGGKTAHLLELAKLQVWALDSDAQRLQRVGQTLQRLSLQARLEHADAACPQQWWDSEPFDAILLDAPCSGSGVGRRHPDIRWLRRPEDIPTLARQQDELLRALWPLVRPGGRLLYATCSWFHAEGQQRIDAFLQRPQAADAVPDPASPGHLSGLPDNGAGTVGLHGSPPAPSFGPSSSPSVLPSPSRPVPPSPGADGFYYALLHKRT